LIAAYQIEVTDFYNQVVLTDNSSIVTASTKSHGAGVSGNYLSSSKHGKVELSEFTVKADPMTDLTLEF
jgi:hypothetical protein